MKKNGHKHYRVDKGPITISGISDVGRVRSENEDSIFIDENGRFMLLADGMGGHERGEEASSTAVNIIHEFLQPQVLQEVLMDITDVEDVPMVIVALYSLVGDAIEKANAVLYERNREANLKRYMGTTVVGLVPVEDLHMLWFHVGDSRLYRWRDSELKCITSDHSAYAEWVDNGRLGDEPSKNVITRAVGPNLSTSADIEWDEQKKGDIYFMCSDGLTDMVTEDQIISILKTENSVDDITKSLVKAANDAGGKDNVSVIACRLKNSG